MIKKFLQEDDGATAIEYGLIAAAMGLALVAIMPGITSTLTTLFASLSTHISTGK